MGGAPKLMLLPRPDFLVLGGGSGLGIVVDTSYSQDLKTEGGSRDRQKSSAPPYQNYLARGQMVRCGIYTRNGINWRLDLRAHGPES